MASLWDRFFDGLVKGIENARDDIRHKVLEEGWFGRQVTDSSTAMDELYARTSHDTDIWVQPDEKTPSPLERPKQSFDELWATEDRAKGIEPPDKDRGIDI